MRARGMILKTLACGISAASLSFCWVGAQETRRGLRAPSPDLPLRSGTIGRYNPNPPVMIPAIRDEVPRAAPAPRGDSAKPKKATPLIVPGELKETFESHQKGAGMILAGKSQVKVDGGKLTAVLTDSVQSNAFYGLKSHCVGPLQMVQEFEIVPGELTNLQVELALSARIDGFLRTEYNGAAMVRVADAAVYPEGGGPTLWVAFPSYGNACDNSECGDLEGTAVRVEQEVESPPLVLPVGKFILVANLVLETNGGHGVRNHAVAVFAPRDPKTVWMFAEEIPFEEEIDEKKFGLTITLKASTPGK